MDKVPFDRHLADCVREMYLNVCYTCSTIIFILSTNHFISIILPYVSKDTSNTRDEHMNSSIYCV